MGPACPPCSQRPSSSSCLMAHDALRTRKGNGVGPQGRCWHQKGQCRGYREAQALYDEVKGEGLWVPCLHLHFTITSGAGEILTPTPNPDQRLQQSLKAPETGCSQVALCFHCQGPGSIPGQGTKIPEALWCGQKKKKNERNWSLNIPFTAALRYNTCRDVVGKKESKPYFQL